MLPGEEGSGNGNVENIDDSESGDVNEDYGSGRFPQGAWNHFVFCFTIWNSRLLDWKIC